MLSSSEKMTILLLAFLATAAWTSRTSGKTGVDSESAKAKTLDETAGTGTGTGTGAEERYEKAKAYASDMANNAHTDEKAKRLYETAKEKMSEATANLGARMRSGLEHDL